VKRSAYIGAILAIAILAMIMYRPGTCTDQPSVQPEENSIPGAPGETDSSPYLRPDNLIGFEVSTGNEPKSKTLTIESVSRESSEPSHPKVTAAVYVTNLRLEATSDVTMVTIDCEENFEFDHQIVEPTESRPFRIAVDIRNAIHQLHRPNFDNLSSKSVLRIRTSQFSIEPEQVVRIVIDLVDSSTYEVRRGASSLVLSINNPVAGNIPKWSDLARKPQPPPPLPRDSVNKPVAMSSTAPELSSDVLSTDKEEEQATVSRAAEPEQREREPEQTVSDSTQPELTLLAVRLDQMALHEAMTAYSNVEGIFVPLGELSALLSLAITVDREHGVAKGSIITEKRKFSLDVAAGRVWLSGREASFDPSLVQVYQEDIFVETQLLSTWFPLDFEIDLYSGTLNVNPREPLPIQLRRLRQIQISKTLASLETTDPELPLIDNSYRLLEVPFVDQAVFAATRKDPGGGRLSETRYTTLATGDFAYMGTSLHLQGNDRDRLSDVRLSMSRVDPGANLLGPLRARQVGLVDIFNPGLDLISRPSSGPGILVTNFPLNRPSQFDRHSIRGDLPPDWEVELYLNDALIGYQQSGLEGRYEFSDIPLLFGYNAIRLVFYGPQGQRHEETKVFNVGEWITPPGSFRYRVAGNDPDQAGGRYSTEFDIGITRHLSTSLGLANVDMVDGQHQYGLLKARSFWKWFHVSADYAMERYRGSVWQFGMQARKGTVALGIQHAEVDNFTSEVFQSAPGSLQGRSTLTFNAAIHIGSLPRVTTTFEARRDQLAEGRDIDRLTHRVATSWRGLYCSNQIQTYFGNSQAVEDQPVTQGRLLVSKFWRRLGIRGELYYDLGPVNEIKSLALSSDLRLPRGYSVGASIARFSDRQTRYLLSGIKNEGAFGIRLTTSYSRSQGLGASFSLSIGIGRDPTSGHVFTQARSMATSGAVSARVFLDDNDNGVMDAGEVPLQGVGFRIGGAGPAAETDQSGAAFLTNLPSHQDTRLTLRADALEDPLWMLAHQGVRLVPRPGKVTQVDFPVIVTGEIAGTVYLRSNGHRRVAAGIDLELADLERGLVIKRITSAYDGFYYISEIPPGRYIMRVSSIQCSLLDLVVPAQRELEFAATGDVLDGINFVLEPLEETVYSGSDASEAN